MYIYLAAHELFSQRLKVSYSDHWTPIIRRASSVVRRQKSLQRTSPTKLLAGYLPKIVSEYDQEIPQSQTANNPIAPQGRAAQPSRDTRKTN